MEVEALETEETAKFRGSPRIKVKSTSESLKTSTLEHDGASFDLTEESIKSLGTGRKIVNSTTGDTHY